MTALTWRRNPGLTLMELLVVLGILALLTALVFPVVSASRRKAQETTCVANLQQISHALAMYTADYDDTFPLVLDGLIVNRVSALEARCWSDLLPPYLASSTFPTCPLREWPANISDEAKSLGGYSGYAMNFLLNKEVGTKQQLIDNGQKQSAVKYPACTLMVLDVRTGIYTALRPDMVQSWGDLERDFGRRIDKDYFDLFLQQTPGAIRHHGGANYSFVDGHVKWLRPEQINTSPQSDGVHPGFGL